jgi:hypothetical protein
MRLLLKNGSTLRHGWLLGEALVEKIGYPAARLLITVAEEVRQNNLSIWVDDIFHGMWFQLA